MTATNAKRTKVGLEDGDDPRRSVPLSFDLHCAEPLRFLIQCLRERAIASDKRRPRPSSISKIDDSFDLIVANVLNAYLRSPKCFAGLSLDSRSFTVDRYLRRRIGYDNFIKAFDYLVQLEPPLLSFHPGFNDRRPGGKGRTSRIKASAFLRTVLRRYIALHRRVRSHEDVNGMLDDTRLFKSDAPLEIPVTWIVSKPPAEIIRLKDWEGRLTKYTDNEETEAMRSRLLKWNRFLSENHHVDLLKSDADIECLFRIADFDAEDDVAASFGDELDRPQFIQFERTHLYRVFNYSSFEQGGRFYGGWWQRIPSNARRYLAINGKPTREFDFSNLHPAMLYAREELPLGEDAYSLKGVDPKYRKLIKATFLRLINAKPGQRIQAPKEKMLPPKMSWSQLQEAVTEKHAPIAKYFRSGVGLELQKIDAAVAEEVMLRLMKKDYLALPIHDSFVVYPGLSGILIDEMKRAYRNQMRGEVGVKPDDTFLELERVKALPDEDGDVPSLEEEVEFRAQEDGYEGYRARLRAFEQTRTEAWHYRFGAGRGFVKS